MMISPGAYLKQMKDATYEQLIKERDGLIRYARRYEKTEKAGVRSGDELDDMPIAGCAISDVLGVLVRTLLVYAK